jgi:hypothetical protein
MAGIGMSFPSQYRSAVVKECKLYHRRKIEPLE